MHLMTDYVIGVFVIASTWLFAFTAVLALRSTPNSATAVPAWTQPSQNRASSDLHATTHSKLATTVMVQLVEVVQKVQSRVALI